MPKVILNYDLIPGLEKDFPNAVVIPYVPNGSRPAFSMCDTVVMADRRKLTTEQMCAHAKKAAPLAEEVIIWGRHGDHSHDTRMAKFPTNGGTPMLAHAM